MIIAMELLTIFILAHLIADFPLQTSQLVDWKKKNWQGIVVHSLIVMVVMGALLFPLLKNMWVTVIIISLLHMLLDGWKIDVERTSWLKPEAQTGYFLLDQLLHGIVLLIASWGTIFYLKQNEIFMDINQLVVTPWEAIFLSIVIWIIFGQAILNQFIISVILGEMRAPFFTATERFGGIFLRGVMIAASFFYLWLGLGVAVLVVLVLLMFKPNTNEPYKVQRLGSIGGFAKRLSNDLYGRQRKLLGVMLNILFGAAGGMLLNSFFTYL